MEYAQQARFEWPVSDEHSRENVNCFRDVDQLPKFRQQKEKNQKKDEK